MVSVSYLMMRQVHKLYSIWKYYVASDLAVNTSTGPILVDDFA
jgi:hypothetical protein